MRGVGQKSPCPALTPHHVLTAWGCGLLTGSRVRDITFPLWRPASAEKRHGATLPKNPRHITLSRHNSLISYSRWRKERIDMGTARLKARTGESVTIRFATYWSGTPGGGGVASTKATDIRIALSVP